MYTQQFATKEGFLEEIAGNVLNTVLPTSVSTPPCPKAISKTQVLETGPLSHLLAFLFLLSPLKIHKESIQLLRTTYQVPAIGTLPLTWSWLCFCSFNPNSSPLSVLSHFLSLDLTEPALQTSSPMPGLTLPSTVDLPSEFWLLGHLWLFGPFWSPSQSLSMSLRLFLCPLPKQKYFLFYLLFILSSTHVEPQPTLLQTFPSWISLATE